MVEVLLVAEEPVAEFPQYHGVMKKNMEDTLAAAVVAARLPGKEHTMVVPAVLAEAALVVVEIIMKAVLPEDLVLVLVPLIPEAAEAALDMVPLNGNIPVEMVAPALL